MRLQVEYRSISRVVLGLIFLASAILKMISLTQFELYLYSFGVGSFDVCSIFARLLIAGEFLLGLWISTGFARKWSNAVTAFVLAAFSLFLIRNLLIGDDRSCNCFGSFVTMPPGVSLGKNALMALILVVAWNKGSFVSNVRTWHLISIALAATTGIFVLSPPDMFYTDRDINLSYPDWDDVVGSYPMPGKKIVCLFSTQCQHCVNCVSKVRGFISRGECTESSVHEFFLRNTDESMEEMISEFNAEYDFQYDILPPDIFISLTNGSFPIILLTEDGKIIREYDYLTIDEQEVNDFFKSETEL